jgi:hypothetical protein
MPESAVDVTSAPQITPGAREIGDNHTIAYRPSGPFLHRCAHHERATQHCEKPLYIRNLHALLQVFSSP